MQSETLEKLKEMAGKCSFPIQCTLIDRFSSANDTLDLSRLTIEDLKKAIDVPKEFRSNQVSMVSYQMEEIRKLVNDQTLIFSFSHSHPRSKN